MKRFILTLIALALLINIFTPAQTINNGILLKVTKESDNIGIILTWTYNKHGLKVYKIYRSLDPALLGAQIGLTTGINGGQFIDHVALTDYSLYFYQVTVCK